MHRQRIESSLEQAIAMGVFPGAALLVADQGEVVFETCLGHASTQGELRPLGSDTLFDLASVTKALGTSVVAMVALSEGRLDLHEPLGRRLPVPPSLSGQPLWHLLAHASGLPAWAPLYLEWDRAHSRATPETDREGRRAWIRRRAMEYPLVSSPGQASLYSDLGFMVLEWWLEEVFSERIDAVLASRVIAPLGLEDTFFVDLDAPERASPHRFAATERCAYRGRVLSGEVHDQNTWAMGGICGQAGLFSNTKEIHRLLRALWMSWCGAPGLFPSEVVRLFFTPCRVPGSSFRLGWDGPTLQGYSAAGARMPAEAVGHLGFTGCSIWLVPSRGLWIVFLTNRVHPSVENNRIRAYRPILHDLLLDELGYSHARQDVRNDHR